MAGPGKISLISQEPGAQDCGAFCIAYYRHLHGDVAVLNKAYVQSVYERIQFGSDAPEGVKPVYSAPAKMIEELTGVSHVTAVLYANCTPPGQPVPPVERLYAPLLVGAQAGNPLPGMTAGQYAIAICCGVFGMHYILLRREAVGYVTVDPNNGLVETAEGPPLKGQPMPNSPVWVYTGACILIG